LKEADGSAQISISLIPAVFDDSYARA